MGLPCIGHSIKFDISYITNSMYCQIVSHLLRIHIRHTMHYIIWYRKCETRIQFGTTRLVAVWYNLYKATAILQGAVRYTTHTAKTQTAMKVVALSKINMTKSTVPEKRSHWLAKRWVLLKAGFHMGTIHDIWCYVKRLCLKTEAAGRVSWRWKMSRDCRPRSEMRGEFLGEKGEFSSSENV